MKTVLVVAVGFGAATMLNAAAMSQSTPQSKVGTTAIQPEQVIVVGCVQREEDYRRARDKGRGGVAGTGVGVGDEFVLTNASMTTQALKPATPAAAAEYELTGSNEEKVKQYVGQRVEIVGKLKAADVGPTGSPTGGGTAGTPPSGVDVASKDLKLRELEVISVSSATGTCPPR